MTAEKQFEYIAGWTEEEIEQNQLEYLKKRSERCVPDSTNNAISANSGDEQPGENGQMDLMTMMAMMAMMMQDNRVEMSGNNDQEQNTKTTEDVIHTANTEGNQAIPKPEVMTDEKKILPEDLKPHQPLFLDRAVPMGRKTVLYGPAKLGKSYLSIAIGESKYIRHPLYIIIDDGSAGQLDLYKKVLGNKADIITLKMVDEQIERQEADKMDAATWRIMCEYYSEDLHRRIIRFDNIATHVYKSMGIKNDDVKPTVFSVVEAIIEEAVTKKGVDFVCLDSLNAFLGDPRKISRGVLQRLFKTIGAKEGITLLVIHHTNKNGEMAGPNATREVFDYVYRLSPSANNSNCLKNESILLLDEEDARYSKPQTFEIKRSFSSDIPYYTLSRSWDHDDLSELPSKMNPTTQIRNILLAHDEKTITLEYLKAQLGKNPPYADETIKKHLGNLSDIAQKTDRKWEIITIIK
jgi:hypothetical protein